MNGVGILENHAKFVYYPEEGKLYIKSEFLEAAQNTFINGYDLAFYDEQEETENIFYHIKLLEDLDRVIFGTSTTFLVRIPVGGEKVKEAKIGEDDADWEFC